MAHAERHRKGWRARYKTPTGWRRAQAPRGTRWTKEQAKSEAVRLERAALGGELPSAVAAEDERPRAPPRRVAAAEGAEKIEARLREMEAAGAKPASVEHVRRTLRTVFNRAIRSKRPGGPRRSSAAA